MDKKSTNIAGAAEPALNNATAAPAQPVVTVTETPASVPGSTPVAETMPATDPVTGAPVDTVVLVKPPKKKKTGLIVSIIIITLLLLGGIGFAIWYFAVYQSPENVVFDSVNKLITAKNVQTEGELNFLAPYEKYDDSTILFQIKFDNQSKSLPTATTATLTMSEVDLDDHSVIEDHEISVELGSVQMSDGVIYFRASEITTALDTFFEDEDDADVFQTALYEIATLIEDEWWQISIPDLIDELDDSGLDLPSSEIKELYSCAVNVMNQDYSGEIAGLYNRNQFLIFDQSVESSNIPGHVIYDMSINYDNLANFLNTLPHASYSLELTTCYNDFLKATDNTEETVSPDDAEKITADNLREAFSDKPTIRFDIHSSSHLLDAITFGDSADNNQVYGYLKFSYDSSEVSAPSEYRPITELFEEAVEIFNYYLMGPEELPGLDFELPVEIGV